MNGKMTGDAGREGNEKKGLKETGLPRQRAKRKRRFLIRTLLALVLLFVLWIGWELLLADLVGPTEIAEIAAHVPDDIEIVTGDRGAIDFPATINQNESQNVSPQDNATVYLVKIFGDQRFDPDELGNEFFSQIGVRPDSVGSPVYVPRKAFYQESQRTDGQRTEKHGTVVHQPWKREESAISFKWIERNEQALKLTEQLAQMQGLLCTGR